MNPSRLLLACFSLFGILGIMGCGSVQESSSSSRSFPVTDFGAVADSKSMNTDAFARAIAACAAAGGGRVIVPPGTYLTGPIHLASDVDLHLERGALVLFSHRFEDYPLVLTNFEGKQGYRCTSPISGDNLQNASITGDGAFDGQGDFWRPAKRNKYVNEDLWKKLLASGGVVDPKTQVWYPSEAARKGGKDLGKLRDSTNNQTPRLEDYVKFRELLRPTLVLFSNCRNLTLSGPTFRNSPEWNIHLFLCDGVTIHSVTLYNPIYAQNGDGIDIDSCRNVTMTDSTVNAGDDAICLKSGRNEEGRKLGKPTENITINNCTIGTGHGGVVVGSEMSGGVRNVSVSNCIMNGTDSGIKFKTVRGRGGVVENMRFDNIEMSNIRGAAIFFTMYYMVKAPTTGPATEPALPIALPEPTTDTTADLPEPDKLAVSESTPQFRQIHISNIHCDGARQAIVMRGLPEMPVQQITIDNTRITATTGGSIIDCKNIILRDVQLNTHNDVSVRSSTGLVIERVNGVAGEESRPLRK